MNAPTTDTAMHTQSDVEPLVSMRALGKSFGSFQALKDINLDIVKGEILTLLGPSGCGKSTLMRTIAGFESPSEGTLLLNGKDMVPIPPERRPVNMVFQRYALFPHLDVFDNIAFGLRLRKLPEAQVRDRVSQMIELVQLGKFANRWINEISGGQAQRVALARALANAPAVLLLDEPLAALDLKIRQLMLIELKRIQQTTGTTFVYVTHDQDEAMILSNRIALIDHGRLVQVGSPDDLYFRPNSMFTARFLGETNVIPARIDRIEGGKLYVVAASGAAVGIDRTGLFRPKQEVDLVLRPEAISLTREGAGDSKTNAAVGTVVVVRPIGGRMLLTARLADGTEVRTQQPRLGPDHPIKAGETVVLSWPEHAVAILPRTATA